ncbi:putative manganese transporter [Paratractidigestivibacter sp.]|uniref:putative manganese transporter n=1 Tax=Paratractidigestivibacter sp. TaxID=2847316 RepID=UPI002ABE8B95|nr:putative manganese transporter [Paratractidigestivibacter sp.]
MDLLVDVLKDSVHDTLNLIPFLLLTYLAMEALEHAASDKVRRIVERTDHAGPIAGALLGALPQCGFSAMTATLFAGRVVTAGTLVAVILSTSDELIPVFVAHQAAPSRMAAIIGIKVVFGLVVGLGLDAMLRASNHTGDGHVHIHELCEREHCHCEDECEEGLADGEGACCGRCCAHKADGDGAASAHAHNHAGHERAHGRDAHAHDHAGHHHHGRGVWGIVRCALVHTVQVAAFIFVITFVFGLIIEGVGEDAIGAALANHPVRATFLSALVGLIPNCGASVAISELFLDGTLATGPMLAGLLSSGGVGLLVLWRTNASARQNLLITVLVYVTAVVAGLGAVALGILL